MTIVEIGRALLSLFRQFSIQNHVLCFRGLLDIARMALMRDKGDLTSMRSRLGLIFAVETSLVLGAGVGR